jgi:RNA recognition motif-containing protein
VKVSLPEKHPRSRYAFVIFNNVRNMLEFMDLKVIKKGNRQLIIKNYTSGNKNRGPSAKKNRLFVHNLPLYWKDDDLKGVFEQYGETNSAYIIMDRNTGESRGFGYVEMIKPQDAISLARMGYLSHDGFQIKVKIHEKVEKHKSKTMTHLPKKKGKRKPYGH